MGSLPESLTQGLLVGKLLEGGLGVLEPLDEAEDELPLHVAQAALGSKSADSNK